MVFKGPLQPRKTCAGVALFYCTPRYAAPCVNSCTTKFSSVCPGSCSTKRFNKPSCANTANPCTCAQRAACITGGARSEHLQALPALRFLPSLYPAAAQKKLKPPHKTGKLRMAGPFYAVSLTDLRRHPLDCPNKHSNLFLRKDHAPAAIMGRRQGLQSPK